jgi:hypothetical protein
MIGDVIAYTVVIWACTAIVTRVYKLFTKQSACDGCSCKHDSPVSSVIPLEMRFTQPASNKASKHDIH